MLTQSFHVVFAPSIVDTYSGYISFTSTDMVTEDIAISGEGVKAEIVLGATVDCGSTRVGSVSREQSFTVVGTNIIDPVTITAPEDFMMSLTTGEGYSTDDIVLEADESLGIDTTIYFVHAPTEARAYSEVFTATTTDDATDTVCSGVGFEAELTLGTTTTRGLVAIGFDSAEGSFTVTGTNLEDDVTIDAPDGFLMSETTGEGYAGTDITLTAVEGAVNATIYYIFRPIEEKVYTDVFTGSSIGVEDTTACTGEGVEITLTLGATVDRGQVVVGEDSAEGTFTIVGSDLQGDVTLISPDGFLASKTTGAGYVSTDLTFTPTEGALSATVYYIFRPTVVKTYSEEFTATSIGRISDTTVCSGEGIEGT
jgi:hypothetical protein